MNFKCKLPGGTPEAAVLQGAVIRKLDGGGFTPGVKDTASGPLELAPGVPEWWADLYSVSNSPWEAHASQWMMAEGCKGRLD